MDEYLRNLLIGDMLKDVMFGIGLISFVLAIIKILSFFTSFNSFIVSLIIVFLVGYKTYTTLEVDIIGYEMKNDKERIDLYRTYMVLLSLKDVVKDKKIKKALEKNINIIKKDIYNYKRDYNE